MLRQTAYKTLEAKAIQCQRWNNFRRNHKKIGFKIDRNNSILDSNGPNARCCGSSQSTEQTESVRYNIGFSLSDGTLDKLASTTVTDEKPDYKVGWTMQIQQSGKNTRGAQRKDQSSSKACNLEFTEWKDKNNMNPVNSNNGIPGPDTCPKKPPRTQMIHTIETNTCTPAGCNPGIPVWGLWDKNKGTGAFSIPNRHMKQRADS